MSIISEKLNNKIDMEISRRKHPQSKFKNRKYPEFVAQSKFECKDSSFYQALSISTLETMIRFKLNPEISNHWFGELERIKLSFYDPIPDSIEKSHIKSFFQVLEEERIF